MRQQFDDFEEGQNSGAEAKPDRKTSLFEILAVLGLIGGLLGYGTYQEFIEPMLVANAKKVTPSPSPTKTPTPKLSGPTFTPSIDPRSPIPNPAATPALPADSPGLPAEPTSAAEIYQRAPKTGVYYPQDSLLNASRREIASSNGRFCIKLVNGPPAAESGQQQVVVSSLSSRSDGIYIDATGEKLQFDRTYTEMTDSTGTWQLLESKGDRTGTSAECLNASGNFVRAEKGDLIQRR